MLPPPPLSATLRGRGSTASFTKAASGEDERGFGAGRSLSRGPASQRGAGTSGGSCCAARAAPTPPGRRLGRRSPVARARVKLPGRERAGSAGSAQAGASAALGSSESAHAWPHRPFAAAARSQAAAPRGQGPAACTAGPRRRARQGRSPRALESLPGSPRPAPLLRPRASPDFPEQAEGPRVALPAGKACRE